MSFFVKLTEGDGQPQSLLSTGLIHPEICDLSRTTPAMAPFWPGRRVRRSRHVEKCCGYKPKLALFSARPIGIRALMKWECALLCPVSIVHTVDLTSSALRTRLRRELGVIVTLPRRVRTSWRLSALRSGVVCVPCHSHAARRFSAPSERRRRSTLKFCAVANSGAQVKAVLRWPQSGLARAAGAPERRDMRASGRRSGWSRCSGASLFGDGAAPLPQTCVGKDMERHPLAQQIETIGSGLDWAAPIAARSG